MRIFTNAEVKIIAATYDAMQELIGVGSEWENLHEGNRDEVIDLVRAILSETEDRQIDEDE